MKAEEITIGSIVLYKSEPCTIEGISVGGSVLLRRKNEFVSRSIEHIWPMPLTSEILEKNGFTRSDFYDELKVGEDWRIMCDTKQVAILHREHVNLDTPICYVHELQHALKLCKIDKEITL